MVQRRIVAWVGLLVLGLAAWAFTGGPACYAANVFWDDAGNSANKLWSNFGNWSPDSSPASDDVFIGNLANAFNDVTLVDQTYGIDSLSITNGADVVNSTDSGATNDFRLNVSGLTTVSGAGSQILIYGADFPPFIFSSASGLDTDRLTINNGGTVTLNSTTAQGLAIVEVDGTTGTGLLDINTGGMLRGTGQIRLAENPASSTVLISNNGAITANTPTFFFGAAPAAGTLRIFASGANAANARFDWDGSPSNGVLNVNGNQTLDIDVSTGIDAFGGAMNLFTGSTIDIAHGWRLDTGTINANTAAFGLILIGQDPNPGAPAVIDGANWTMTGGTIEIADKWDSLQLDSQLVASGGTINNSGHMIFNGSASIQSGVDFNMIDGGASLTVNSSVNIFTPNFDLDGNTSSGNVTTINAGGDLDLALGAGADENFGHTINMNGGRLEVTTADNTWSLSSGGEINVDGGGISTIQGETFGINGEINVAGNSLLNIRTPSNYSSAAKVVVKAGSTLDHPLIAVTTYNGGSYTGGGILKTGNAVIASSTTMDVATVDLDDGDMTINNGATLTVNADSIDDTGDGIDRTITISDTGRLAVNISGGGAWTVDGGGRISYVGNASVGTFLAGSNIKMNGTLNVTGDGQTNAVLNIGSTGTVNIQTAGQPLRLARGNLTTNANTLDGGTINGPGLLNASTGRALRGKGTINADVDFDGSAELVALGGLLTVNGNILDVGTLGANGVGSRLHLANALDSSVTQNGIRLENKAAIQGATITLSTKNLRGRGTVQNRINNNNSIIAQGGGELRIDNANNVWDGSTNSGVLRAQTGDLRLIDNNDYAFEGTVQVDSGQEVFASGFALDFQPTSNLILTKGIYRSTEATDFGGSITVNAGGNSAIRIPAAATFESTSSTTLDGNLELENSGTVIESGATFAGGSSLINLAGSTLTLLDGADVDVLLENRGTLVLGASPGQTSGTDFQQSATGKLEIELQGTGLSAYDRMSLTSIAQLGGELEVSLIGGFSPLVDDLFTIITAPGSVLGTFSFEDFSGAALAPGLAWDVLYNPTNVQLQVVSLPAFTADFDNDGDVDGDDLVHWEGNFGGPGSDADGDGDSDGADFLAWQQQFGSGVPLPAASSNVPEPSTLLLASLAACFGLLTRRNKGSAVI